LIAIAAISITTTDNAFAYEKNQATSQTGACGNGLLSVNIGRQNTDSQIQGDENVVALTPPAEISSITGESSSSPPTSSPSGEDIERICADGIDNDGDGLVDAADPL
jgi:hypothetical protein